jgi:hypothetical protein
VAEDDDVLIEGTIQVDAGLASLRITVNELFEVSVMVVRRGIG